MNIKTKTKNLAAPQTPPKKANPKLSKTFNVNKDRGAKVTINHLIVREIDRSVPPTTKNQTIPLKIDATGHNSHMAPEARTPPPGEPAKKGQ